MAIRATPGDRGVWIGEHATDPSRRLIALAVRRGWEMDEDAQTAIAAYDAEDDGLFSSTLPDGQVVTAAGYVYWLSGYADMFLDLHVAPDGYSFSWDERRNYRLESNAFWGVEIGAVH